MSDLPDLESLRCFVHAASALNFRAASRAVGLTPAALGQRIRKLEDQLDVQLFDRNTRRVALTQAGLALLPAAHEALDAARECVRAARGLAGPVPMDLMIGTRHELGLSWVMPMLPKLREGYPGLTFHLYFGSGHDLELRVHSNQIDCAISSRRVTDPKLDSFRIHPEHYAFVAAPELLEHSPLKTAEDARNHTLVDTNGDLPLFKYWRDAPGGSDSLSFKKLIRMGTIAAIHQLVLDGAGVAVLPLYLVEPDIETGFLVRVMPDVEPNNDWFRLIIRADDPRRALFADLAEILKNEPLR